MTLFALTGLNSLEELVHFVAAREFAHLFIGGLHEANEGFAVGRRHVHALLLEFLHDGGFAMGNLVARQVLLLIFSTANVGR